MAAVTQQPIDTLLLADPERVEDHHHARGMRAALHVRCGQHRQGRPVQAGVSGDLAEQQDAGDRRSGRTRRAADLGVRVRRDPAISRPQDGPVLPKRRARRVEVEQWLFWQMGGFGPMLGQAHHFRIYAPGKDPLRHRSLHERDEPALRRPQQAPRRPRIRGGRLFHRRHGDLRLGQAVGAPGPGHRGVSRMSSAGSIRCSPALPCNAGLRSMRPTAARTT